MMTLLILVLMPFAAEGVWDCNYELGMKYEYMYTSELVDTVTDKTVSPFNLHGVTIEGVVSLTPLSTQDSSFFIEVYIEQVTEHKIEALYSHHLDHETFTGLFYSRADHVLFPRDQDVHGSNIVRSIISAVRIYSCSRTGIYTTQEVTIAGAHTSSYEARMVNRVMLDGHVYNGEEIEEEETYRAGGNMDVTRTVGRTEGGVFRGNTAAKHRQFLTDVINEGATRQYNYMLSSRNLIENCVVYEMYSPQHNPGYASNAHVTVRTSLKLGSTIADIEQLYLYSLTEIQDFKLYGAELIEASIAMEYSIPNLRPDSLISGAAAHLRELLGAGYESTSIPVVQAWLDIVRHIYVGISNDEGKAVFEVADHGSLSWFIDAASVNGTAQLHLMVHNAIKLSRAHQLTERFIASKQFTADPPLRMLRWLLRTCNIERYSEVCSLAIASSATSFFNANNEKLSIVNSIFEHLTEKIESVREEEEKLFYVATLGNMKLPEAARYLVNLILSDSSPDVRRVAAETLRYQRDADVTLEDRTSLLEHGLTTGDGSGAATLYYVFSSAAHHNLPTLIESAVSAVCSVQIHRLSGFLHQALATLSQSSTDPARASVVAAEVARLQLDCLYCLPEQQESPSIHVASSFIFGSSVSGGELKYERYGAGSGTTTLALNFLQQFGLTQNILQTSFALSPTDALQNEAAGDLYVIVNGDRVNARSFEPNSEAKVEANILLADITHLLPTLSGIPLSYSMIGSLRSETVLSPEDFPVLSVDNKLGLYLSTEFRVNGAPSGWDATTSLVTHYKDIYDVTNDVTNDVNVMERHTTVNSLTFKIDTVLPSDWSSVSDNTNFFEPIRLLECSISTGPDTAPSHSNIATCEELGSSLEAVTFGEDVIEFDSKSYLGQWFAETQMSELDTATIFEVPEFACSEALLLSGVAVGAADGSNVTVHVQTLYGIFVVGSHSRVQTFGDSAQRNLRLEGYVEDVVDLLHRLEYYPLAEYTGPDLVTVRAEVEAGSAQAALLLYVEHYC